MSGLERNDYWIPKHRYEELKHFCLQIPQWQKEYSYLTKMLAKDGYDPTGDRATALARLSKRIELVRQASAQADCGNTDAIFLAVSRGYGWQQTGVPQESYWRFWYFLSELKE